MVIKTFVLFLSFAALAPGVSSASSWQCWTLSDDNNEINRLYASEIPKRGSPDPNQNDWRSVCTALLKRYSLTQSRLGKRIIENKIEYGSSCNQTFNKQPASCCFDNVVYAGFIKLGREDSDLNAKGWICSYK